MRSHVSIKYRKFWIYIDNLAQKQSKTPTWHSQDYVMYLVQQPGYHLLRTTFTQYYNYDDYILPVSGQTGSKTSRTPSRFGKNSILKWQNAPSHCKIESQKTIGTELRNFGSFTTFLGPNLIRFLLVFLNEQCFVKSELCRWWPSQKAVDWLSRIKANLVLKE